MKDGDARQVIKKLVERIDHLELRLNLLEKGELETAWIGDPMLRGPISPSKFYQECFTQRCTTITSSYDAPIRRRPAGTQK